MKKASKLELPFELERVQFPSHKDTFRVKLSSSEKEGHKIWLESKRKRRQWCDTFSDISKCSDNGIQIPSQMFLDNMIQALNQLDLDSNESRGKDLSIENGKPQCDIKVRDDIFLFFSIPLGVSSINFTFTLPPVEISELQILTLKHLDMEDVIEDLDKQMKQVKSTSLKAIDDEIKDLKKECKNLKIMMESFLFRDAGSLKKMGYSLNQLKQAGFSKGELISAWNRDELETEGFTFSPAQSFKLECFHDETDHARCQLSKNGRSVIAILKDGYRYATTADPLPEEGISFFKATIDHCEDDSVIIGLIGESLRDYNPYQKDFCSFRNETAYLWGCDDIWTEGESYQEYGSWAGFSSKDEVFFMYDPMNKLLTMKVKERATGNVRYGPSAPFELECKELEEAFIHINLKKSGDQVTIDEMTDEEVEHYFGDE